MEEKNIATPSSCFFGGLLLLAQADIDYETLYVKEALHGERGGGVMLSVVSSGRPVTFPVLSFVSSVRPMLHINMLGHMISCMWSFFFLQQIRLLPCV